MVQTSNSYTRATLDALSAQIGVLDADGAVLLANTAWRAFAAAHAHADSTAAVAEGANYLEACDGAGGDERVDATAIAAGIRQVIAGERGNFQYEHSCGAPGAQRWLSLGVTGIAAGSKARAVVARNDVTELRRGTLLLGLEHTVARGLARASNAGAAIKEVIRVVCETQGWDCGRYFRLDPAAGMLCFDESWGVSDAAVEQFLERSRGLVFHPGAGLTGRVCESGQPLWAPGGAPGSLVSAMALAPETGLDGALVFPVIAENVTLGVLAFSSRTVSTPDDLMLHAVHSIGRQLGRLLRRLQSHNTLYRSEQRFRRLTDLSADWYWEQDRGFRYTQYVGSGVLDAAAVLGKALWDLPGIVLGDARWAEHKSQLGERWSFCDF